MKGFAALISVIIIGSIMIFAGMMVTLTSVNEGQMSVSNYLKNDNIAFMDACTEDALLFINESSTLPATITTPQGNCTTSINSQVGTSWDFNINATLGDYQRSSRIKLNRGSNLSIGSWQDQ